MASIAKIKSMIADAIKDDGERRHLITVDHDGHWDERTVRVPVSAWEAVIFQLRCDPLVETVDEITDTVCLIRRKAEKKAPGSK